MVDLFWSIPRFFYNAIAWSELNFIFKCNYNLFHALLRIMYFKIVGQYWKLLLASSCKNVG